MNTNKDPQSNTKDCVEVFQQIHDIIEGFNLMIKKGVTRMSAHIENVQFTDLLVIFHTMQQKGYDVRLYMPGECFNEAMNITYYIARGYYISIESEQCLIYKPKINTINYN